MKYELYVDDNYYYDEDARYKAGEYETIESAIVAAKEIVDGFLLAVHKKKPDISAEALYSEYKLSGEDPWIHPNHSNYNSWDYAKKRCDEICGRAHHVIITKSSFTAPSLQDQKEVI